MGGKIERTMERAVSSQIEPAPVLYALSALVVRPRAMRSRFALLAVIFESVFDCGIVLCMTCLHATQVLTENEPLNRVCHIVFIIIL
jgi:hypothetical protein